MFRVCACHIAPYICIYIYMHLLLEMFVLQEVLSAASTLDQSVGMLGALTFERPEWAES